MYLQLTGGWLGDFTILPGLSYLSRVSPEPND